MRLSNSTKSSPYDQNSINLERKHHRKFETIDRIPKLLFYFNKNHKVILNLLSAHTNNFQIAIRYRKK